MNPASNLYVLSEMDYLKKITATRPRASRVSRQADLVIETESNRGRIIQSAAVRRLQQKTQVYPLETNAAVRSRLTHSLEVQQTGRFLAKTILERLKDNGELASLNLEGIETAFTNLVEMACLLHDVGNPPFGHFGEAAISRWMQDNARPCHNKSLAGIAGHSDLFVQTLLPDLYTFEGNAQGLRIIETLQELNLTWSQTGALLKYTRSPSQPKPDSSSAFHYRQKKPGFYFSEQPLVEAMWQHLEVKKGCRFPLVYIMEAADDISYCIADLEDAVDKGILSLRGLQYFLQEIWWEFADRDNDYLPDIIKTAKAQSKEDSHAFIIRLRTRLVSDLVDYAANRFLQKHQEVFDGTLDEPLIDGGSHQHLALQSLKEVAVRHVFNSREKETPELRGYAGLMGLMDIYRPILELPGAEFLTIVEQDRDKHFIEQRLYHRLSPKYKAAYRRSVEALKTSSYTMEEQNDLEWYYRARLIIDYISGMTDHFVMTEYQSLSAI